MEEVHRAAKKGDTDQVRSLISRSPELVSCKDESGWTPLHYAVAHNKLAVVKVLLAAGADPNAKISGGGTPLRFARHHGYSDIEKLLLEKSGDNQPTGHPVEMGDELEEAYGAIWENDADHVRLLISRSPDLVTRKDEEGLTLLHRAAHLNKLEVVEALLAAGADRNAKDNDGWRPIRYAISLRHSDILGALLDERSTGELLSMDWVLAANEVCLETETLGHLLAMSGSASSEEHHKAEVTSAQLVESCSEHPNAAQAGLLMAYYGRDIAAKKVAFRYLEASFSDCNIKEALEKLQENIRNMGELVGLTSLPSDIDQRLRIWAGAHETSVAQIIEYNKKQAERRTVIAWRKDSKLCIHCGKKMSRIALLLGKKSHSECKEFRY